MSAPAHRALALACLALCACGGRIDGSPDAGVDASEDAGPLPLLLDELPATFPRPVIPSDEPVTRERVELGRHLFYDARLSLNETQSCASCHEQARAFTDGRPVGVGSTSEAHFRNAQSLVNVAFRPSLTWANPVVVSLSEQALIPMFGETPVELGFSGHEDELLARLRDDPTYDALFAAAYPGVDDPVTLHAIVVALAAFERTILSFRSPYDRYAYAGDRHALDDSAKRGLALFFDERLECFHCHGGPDFTDATRTTTSPVDELPFHNTGLYDVDGFGSYPAIDRGVMNVTSQGVDMGRFRAPSLRNVAVTAPYFHDGSAATLDDVLDHYSRGGRLIASGPYAGDGSHNVFKSELLQGFTLTAQERADVLAFLMSLTDQALLVDPRLSNPWPPSSP